MTDDLDRAEQAFRTALASRAGSFVPTALDVPTPRRPRRWPLLVAAAAAAVVLVVGLVAVVGGHRDEAAPAHVLPDGWRWESYADVMVGVPDSWGYADAPRRGCGSAVPDPSTGLHGPGPGRGYVDSRAPVGRETYLNCITGAPHVRPRAHLSFSDPKSELPVPLGWRRDTRILGGTHVTVTIDQDHEQLAKRILATAHVVRRDQNGCTPSSPLQDPLAGRPSPAFDVSALEGVDSIAVCQYALGDPGAHLTPGLIASQLLTGARADAELAALQAAGTDGGPNVAHSCGADDRGDTGITLLLTSGHTTHEMYAIYESCSANGIDDGTHLRELTRADCRPLFDARIQIVNGYNAAFGRCHTSPE